MLKLQEDACAHDVVYVRFTNLHIGSFQRNRYRLGKRSVYSPEVDDPPHVGAEPHGGAGVGLVLPDQDGVGHRKESDQRTVLEELQDFRLIGEAPEGQDAQTQTRGPSVTLTSLHFWVFYECTN